MAGFPETLTSAVDAPTVRHGPISTGGVCDWLLLLICRLGDSEPGGRHDAFNAPGMRFTCIKKTRKTRTSTVEIL